MICQVTKTKGFIEKKAKDYIESLVTNASVVIPDGVQLSAKGDAMHVGNWGTLQTITVI